MSRCALRLRGHESRNISVHLEEVYSRQGLPFAAQAEAAGRQDPVQPGDILPPAHQ